MIIKFPIFHPIEDGRKPCARCRHCTRKRYTRTNEMICIRGRMFGVCMEWDLTERPRELRVTEDRRVYEVAANG